jgi:PncC family amidohydrolase
MAIGVCRLMGADWGVSITGVAGPSGGSRSKPVGTVYIGLCGPARQAEIFRLHLSGDRDRIRASSVQLALNQLRLALQQDGALLLARQR